KPQSFQSIWLPRGNLKRPSPKPLAGRHACHAAPFVYASGTGRLPVKRLAKLRFGLTQDAPPLGRERLAAAVDLEVEHRHGGPERARPAPTARLRRPLQRLRHLLRSGFLEDSALEVERIASLHDAGGPFASGFAVAPRSRPRS